MYIPDIKTHSIMERHSCVKAVCTAKHDAVSLDAALIVLECYVWYTCFRMLHMVHMVNKCSLCYVSMI